ncbi:L-asparaginase [Mycolicibacterium sp. BK556]|uniref:asparaginase n=1 Tax=Mycobacteriaceae TaxID=1762 RepID=UPI0010609169|nr:MULTISPECIES: asparaginase [Mycobacteriaceae]MBB3606735.1 L-asparaginase [Mycolicibacterium sp. BK556]MBB3636599.1 L-asparaginase [Mycolicibacterium sp. BK607]TDO17043.1 asparaginase [Mycobacterium sp. BK086]
MPRLVVVTTGGTISTSADSEGVLRPVHSGAELASGLDAQVIDLFTLDSSQLTPAEWVRIGAAVADAASDADGIVVTHGTDTLEETALWLELTYAGATPVVVTGSALPADAPDADGPGNLRDALTVAASPLARDLGVLICFGGALLPALGTTKVGGGGFFGGRPRIGSVSDGVFSMTGDTRRAYLGVAREVPRVDIVAAYPGCDGAAIDAFALAGARGLVVEAMGAGNAGTPVVEAVRRACARGLAVAVTTRVPLGRTVALYGPGHDLVEAGAVMVPQLRSSQARVLLMVALSLGLPVAEVIARWG